MESKTSEHSSEDLCSEEAATGSDHEAGGEQGARLCDPFLDQLVGLMHHGNVKTIVKHQEHILGTLEVANQKLSSLNAISEEKFQNLAGEFRHNTRTLAAMKKDLDSIFRRIRSLKTRLAAQYPQGYKAAVEQLQLTDEELQ